MSEIVGDASAVVALLVDGGADGEWVTGQLRGAGLAAPHLLPFEVDNVLRRLERTAVVTAGAAAQARADARELDVELWPHEALAERVWELCPTLTAYDAAYVALAELLAVPLVTLDRRLARAPGVRCPVVVR